MKTTIYLLPQNYQPDQGKSLNRLAFIESTILRCVQAKLPLLDPLIRPDDIKLGMYMPGPGGRIALLLEAVEPSLLHKPVDVAYRGNLAGATFFVNSIIAHVRENDAKLAEIIGKPEHSPAANGNFGATSLGFHVTINCNFLTEERALLIGDAFAAGIVAAMPQIAQQ